MPQIDPLVEREALSACHNIILRVNCLSTISFWSTIRPKYLYSNAIGMSSNLDLFLDISVTLFTHVI